jgi:ABC-type uncharacterized transport system auxiliary subunit
VGCEARVAESAWAMPGRKRRPLGVIAGLLIMVVLGGGCAAMFARPAPASVFQLAYSPRLVACPASFPASVRVWPLEASPPYDQEALVVLADDARVRFSSQYAWVAQPGRMAADRLLRDLSQTQLFSSVMTSGETAAHRFDLGGHLFAFAWQRWGDQWQAVLDVEITLLENRSDRSPRILLRKPYRLVSEPAAEHHPEAFARAMSQVMSAFSTAVQEDLCTQAVALQPPAGSAGQPR